MNESVEQSAERLLSDRLQDSGSLRADIHERLLAKARTQIRALRQYDERSVSDACVVDCCEGSPAQQQFKDEVDINTIVRRFGTGQVPPPRGGGVYGDFTGITDFESARERVERATADFMRLAPEVRERFGNDPGRFLREAPYMTDAELAPPAPVEPPVAAPEPAPASE